MPLRAYLLAQYCEVYEIQTLTRATHKTDNTDAHFLAKELYKQIGLHIQERESQNRIIQRYPATEGIWFLARVIQHCYELSHELTKRKNKLRFSCDELFPEFTEVCKAPSRPSAFALLECFPRNSAPKYHNERNSDECTRS